MAQKDTTITVNGNTITAVVTGGGPAPLYDATAAQAMCRLIPMGPEIPPTTRTPAAGPPPTCTFTFVNLPNGLFAVTVVCSTLSFVQTVRLPQQNSFTFSHTFEQPQSGLDLN
jgi:hypothetical protein